VGVQTHGWAPGVEVDPVEGAYAPRACVREQLGVEQHDPETSGADVKILNQFLPLNWATSYWRQCDQMSL
jgi:hypothetical protein